MGNIPVFGILTAREGARKRFIVAVVSVAAAGAILIPATFFGQFVLDVLNITIESFQIAAGVLLMLPAIRLVESGLPMRVESIDPEDTALTRAFVPLATPLLAGPGAIATAVVFRETLGAGDTVIAIVAILALTAAAFATTASIIGFLGRTPILIMAKMVGILLIAIAVQLIFRGLSAVL